MYVAVYDGNIISCHRKREQAVKSLLEYRGFSTRQINKLSISEEEALALDPCAKIIKSLK